MAITKGVMAGTPHIALCRSGCVALSELQYGVSCCTSSLSSSSVLMSTKSTSQLRCPGSSYQGSVGGKLSGPGCRIEAFDHPSQVTSSTGSLRSDDTEIRNGSLFVKRAVGSTIGSQSAETVTKQNSAPLPTIPVVSGMNNGVSVLEVGKGTSVVERSPSSGRSESLSTLVEPVAADLRSLNDNLHAIIGSENPLLMAAAEQIFGAGGKRLRPAIVFLVSRATAQLAGLEEMRPQHWRLAQVIEMIHTASLMHDDILDESATRRGKDTIHTIFGTRIAVLAGDFMFAQSSWYLANLDNLEVIKLISQVIKDFASGEIKQAMSLFDCNITLEEYLEKSYYKTASLIAASTRSAAIFSGMNNSICDQMYNYGLHLGLAFQVVDDILDFTQTSEQLGKPAGSDLAKGNLTAPVLFALKREPELRDLINSEFCDEGSLDAAIALVTRGGGIEQARQLAREKGHIALKNIECLPHGPLRHSLEGFVDYVLDRVY